MKNVLCIGGDGNLGKSVIKVLKGHTRTCVDFTSSKIAENNILLDHNLSVQQNHQNVLNEIKKNKILFDSIIVTAGSWIGGSIQDQDYIQKYQKMMATNFMPSLLAGHIAAKYFAHKHPKQSIIFTGAAAVFREPQPSMLAYSLAKTAVHSLSMNIAENITNNRQQTSMITILPEVIDTVSNREAMPNEDFKKWAKPEQIAQLIKGWVEGYNIPKNGSFILLKVKNQNLTYDFV